MSRVDITQDVVLQRIAARLRDQMELNDRQCYETISEPMDPPKILKGGDIFVTVAPADSQFVEGEQVSGNFTEQWDVVVSGYSRIQLDATDHGERKLRDAGRGMFIVKRDILKALVGNDLTTTGEDTFLRTTLYARSCRGPLYVPERKLGMVMITFGVDFDWDIT